MNTKFLASPANLRQALGPEVTSGGGSFPTRRRFLKQTGGMTVATMVAWHATIERARAEDEEASASASCSCSSKYVFRLASVDPMSSDSVHNVAFNVMVGGVATAAQVSIEIGGGSPIGGFPSKMLNCEFSYGAIASVAVADANNILQQAASVEISISIQVDLPNPCSPTIKSSGLEDNGMVLPSRSDVSFTVDGKDYNLELIYNHTTFDGGAVTFASGSAKVTGAASANTSTKKVEHTFEPIPD